MALVSVSNLVYHIGDRALLDGVNLTLNEGEHVGLVGRNGCGKSTLLKMIAGLANLKPDSGQVQVARGASVGYLTQDPDLNPQHTLIEEAQTAFAHLHELHQRLEQVMHDMATAQGDVLNKLMSEYEELETKVHAGGGYALEHQIEATLHGVGLTDTFFGVKVKDLSGGQKGRLALAKLLLTGPDVLLMDEPTNHLDIPGREWLEAYLAQYRGALVVVSHDRWLLDRVASKIYELEEVGGVAGGGVLVEYPGNYQAYREQRAERRLAQQRLYDKQKERIKSEQQFIDRYRAGQRAAQAQGREKRLDRYKRDMLIDRPIEMESVSMQFRPKQRAGDLIVTADHLSKAYDQKVLFRELSLVIKRGDRVGIIGPNGAGKSTLVNCLLGLLPADAGVVRLGGSSSVGHYRQSHEHLDLSQSVVEYLRGFVLGGTRGPGSEQAARDAAGAFMFSGDEQEKPLTVLSGGERSRVVLAGLVAGGHNVLVLDEPTNHLDIMSAERLEEALRTYTAKQEGFGDNQPGGGTLILITHDRMLLEHLANQLLILDGAGNVRHFLGTYSEYSAAQRPAVAAPSTPEAKREAARQGKPSRPGREAQQGQGGKGGALSRLSQEALEARIVEVEGKLVEVDKRLADPDAYRDGGKVRKLQEQRETLGRELRPLEEEWKRRAQ